MKRDLKKGVNPIPNTPAVSPENIPHIPTIVPQFKISLSHKTYVVAALIVSGSASKFMDLATTAKLQLPLFTWITLYISAQLIEPHWTWFHLSVHAKLSLCIRGMHQEIISLLITNTSRHPIILGIPWLHTHNIQISWKQWGIVKWSK